MTGGRMILGRAVYAHELDCPAALKRARREQTEQVGRAVRRLAAEAANLPADPRGVGDLASYIERFGQDPPFARGVLFCTRFAAACAVERLPDTGFTLRGRLGSGKTTLLAALARSLVDRGVRVRWETVPELYNRLLGLVRGGGRLEEALRELAAVGVLFMDDLGSEKPSPWYVDQVLFPVVDERYRNGRPMVLSTNYGWQELQDRLSGATSERGEVSESGPRIRDRLEEVAVMVEFGPDRTLRRPRAAYLEEDPRARAPRTVGRSERVEIPADEGQIE